MTEKERMFAGKLYCPYKVESQWFQIRNAVKKFNESEFWKDSTALENLKKLFLSVGENVVLTPPFYCDHGNKISFGNPCKVMREITDKDKEYWRAQYLDYINDVGDKYEV